MDVGEGFMPVKMAMLAARHNRAGQPAPVCTAKMHARARQTRRCAMPSSHPSPARSAFAKSHVLNRAG